MPRIDLTNQVFGRLIVLHEAPKKGFHRYWECLCTCGIHTLVGQSNLRAGKSTSCGCYAKQLAGETYKSKFEIHGDYKERLYKIHRHMLDRCYKTWDNNYPRYGAMGITVCSDWLDYQNFKEWALSSGYNDTLTIDRVNGALGYCPENCRWATYQTQTRNRRKQNKPASSKYIGVSKERHAQKWLASLCVSGKTTRIGYFDNEECAAKARDQYILDHGLQHFKMNF